MRRSRKVTKTLTYHECLNCKRQYSTEKVDDLHRHLDHMKRFKKGMFVTDSANEMFGKIVKINRKDCTVDVFIFKEETIAGGWWPEDLWLCCKTTCDILDHNMAKEIHETRAEWSRRRRAIHKARGQGK